MDCLAAGSRSSTTAVPTGRVRQEQPGLQGCPAIKRGGNGYDHGELRAPAVPARWQVACIGEAKGYEAQRNPRAHDLRLGRQGVQLGGCPALVWVSLRIPVVSPACELRGIGRRYHADVIGAAVHALRDSMLGTFPSAQLLLVLAGWAVVFGVLAVRFFRWE
jgi:hypothetical protein